MPLGLVRAENNVGENMEVYKDKVGKVKKKNLWNEGNRLLGKMETDELQEWRRDWPLSSRGLNCNRILLIIHKES